MGFSLITGNHRFRFALYGIALPFQVGYSARQPHAAEVSQSVKLGNASVALHILQY
jgi:hypothetical protein